MYIGLYIQKDNFKIFYLMGHSSVGLRLIFSLKFDPHPPSRNANNVELYKFVMVFFSGKAETHHPRCVT